MSKYQIDYVLQKENLTHHHQVHPAMHMPSHGAFMLEYLTHLGFKSGLVFGLDDFSINGSTLNRSSSEILIVCGADQHYNQAFLEAWKGVKKNYACRILIVSEPIYSPLAYYQNSDQNAKQNHERFLMEYEPDIILYLSRFDCLEAKKRLPSGLQVLLYSLADPAFLTEPINTWRKKESQLLWLGFDQTQCLGMFSNT